MTCHDVEPELVAYHFGLLEGDAREAIEAHLATCGECLRAFLAVKRAIEVGAEDAPRSGEAARARLRRAVAAELGVDEPSTVAPSGTLPARWHRPLAFALAASVVLFAGRAAHSLVTGPGAPPYAMSAGRSP
jgi:anti-sigma factor RsiW